MNPEKEPKSRTDEKEIPVTHEDIDLKEFTRRLNEKESVQAPEETKEEAVPENTEKPEEELKTAREEAEEAFGERKESSENEEQFKEEEEKKESNTGLMLPVNL